MTIDEALARYEVTTDGLDGDLWLLTCRATNSVVSRHRSKIEARQAMVKLAKQDQREHNAQVEF